MNIESKSTLLIQFFLFITAFVLFTIIGTLSHEFGHILVAKSLGYETTLHFGSMNWESSQPYSEKDDLFILIGGPLQTIFTGIIGLLFLFKRRYRNEWKMIDWIAVFLSLFWLRPVFNLVISIGSNIYYQTGSLFGGDELKIAHLMNVWEGTFSLLFALIGTLISCFVIFKIVPKQSRIGFIISSLIGSLVGYITWFKILGPILLP